MGGKDFERFAYQKDPLDYHEEIKEQNKIQTSSNIPYPHRLIKTAGSKKVGLVIKVNAKHKVGVSLQNLDRGALRNPVFGRDKRPGWGKSYKVKVPYSYSFIV